MSILICVKLMRSGFGNANVTDRRSFRREVNTTSMSQTPIDFHAEQYTRAAQWLLSGTHRGSLTAIKIKLGRRFMVDYGYPFDRIRDHTAVAGLLEAMTAIWRSI